LDALRDIGFVLVGKNDFSPSELFSRSKNDENEEAGSLQEFKLGLFSELELLRETLKLGVENLDPTTSDQLGELYLTKYRTLADVIASEKFSRRANLKELVEKIYELAGLPGLSVVRAMGSDLRGSSDSDKTKRLSNILADLKRRPRTVPFPETCLTPEMEEAIGLDLLLLTFPEPESKNISA
jgi:hypothetical protein